MLLNQIDTYLPFFHDPMPHELIQEGESTRTLVPYRGTTRYMLKPNYGDNNVLALLHGAIRGRWHHEPWTLI